MAGFVDLCSKQKFPQWPVVPTQTDIPVCLDAENAICVRTLLIALSTDHQVHLINLARQGFPFVLPRCATGIRR